VISIQSALGFLKPLVGAKRRSDATLPWYTVGLIVGFRDGYDGQPYDDGSSRVHDLTVCVPGVGSSAYAAGYRDGFLTGRGEQITSA
jgi:hypothetical protein